MELHRCQAIWRDERPGKEGGTLRCANEATLEVLMEQAGDVVQVYSCTSCLHQATLDGFAVLGVESIAGAH